MRETFPKELLGRVLQRASNTPFYRHKLPTAVTSLEQWQQLPLTTKEDLRSAYPFGFLAIPREKLATYHESSGSTGEPTPSYFTEKDWENIATRFARNGVKICNRDMVLVKTPYSMVTTAHQMHRAARSRGALVVPADNRSSNMPYSKVVRLLKDLPITLAWCLPTEALFWAAAARLAGFDPAKDFPRLRAFLVAGEPLSEAKRSRIEELWGGVDVFQDYGSTETGSLAGECSKKHLHLWADDLFFEIVDGQLVATPIEREAMPLVRYLIGDQVEMGAKCDCGSTFPTIKVFGRESDELRAADLESHVYTLPLEHEVFFWRARGTKQSVQVEIESVEKYGREASMSLEDSLRRDGIRAEVRSVAPGTIVSLELLQQKSIFMKPRFVFPPNEDWKTAVNY